MCKLFIVKLSFLIIFAICSIATTLQKNALAQSLAVKKIYLVEAAGNVRDRRMYAIFRTELTKKGSSIVTNVEEADAILYIFAWTMMSPTQSPPAELLQNEYSKLSKYEYECQLKSRELKILWATKFECWTEDEEEKSDHAAARKIAKQLLKALPQYAKKQRK